MANRSVGTFCQNKDNNAEEKNHVYCNDHWVPALQERGALNNGKADIFTEN